MSATTISTARARHLHDRALAKSMEQVRANNLPQLVSTDDQKEVWSVHSRTAGGQVWLVTLDLLTGEIACDCPAGILCWHRIHVYRARAGEIGHHAPPRRPR